jgi:serine/threonine-protein kinase
LFGEIHPRVAASLSMLSRFYRHANRWPEAEAAARQSVAIAGQIFDEGHPDLTFPMYELAAVLNKNGATAEARELLQQVVVWERTSLGPDNHDLGMSLKAYGETLLNLAEFGEAESILRESQDIFLRLHSSPRALDAVETLLGLVYMRSGRLREAEDILGVADGTLPNDVEDAELAARERAIAELELARETARAAETRLNGFSDAP